MTRAAVLLACFLLAGKVAAASPAEDQARQAFERGRALHASGRYPEAIREYERAYQLLPLPEFVFNIGQCYRLAGDREKAVEHYRRYLTLLARGGASDDARAHIARLQAEEQTGASPPTADRPGRSPWRWIGLGMTGAGVVGLGTGVWFRFEAAAGARALERARGPFDAELAAIDRERVADTRRMWIFLGVGAGLIAGGVITLLLIGDERDMVAVQPVLAPGRAAVTLSGRF